jgi:site-specific recombinase XerC
MSMAFGVAQSVIRLCASSLPALPPRIGLEGAASFLRKARDLGADEMVAKGLSGSTIDSTLNPVRAIYRYAIARNETTANPTRGLETPAIRSKPKRIADADEARKLLDALREGDQATWATALYAACAVAS